MVELSIIIVNYNTFSLTAACIASVYQHTRDLNFEIVVVDNCSVDEDASQFKALFPQIKLIVNSENLGFAKANNIGLKYSEGDMVLLLNSDTLLFDNSIGNAYQKLRNATDYDVITGKLLYPDGALQYQCGRFPSILLQCVELFRIQKLLPTKTREHLLLGGFFDHLSPAKPDWIWGAFFMFHTKILTAFPKGILPETYFMYQEDLEWCYLLRKGGYQIRYDPTIGVIHYFGGSIKSSGAYRQMWLRTNFRDFVKRYYGLLFSVIYFALMKLNHDVNDFIKSIK
jgi:GT2 family glycosyltransferase